MWIIGSVGTTATAFGIGKMLERRQARRHAREDRAQDISEANEGKRIDADQEALKIILKRLESVEQEAKATKAEQDAKIEALTQQVHSLMIQNERLKTEAEHSEKEQKRQDDEIQSLRRRNHDLSNEISQRDSVIAKLEARIGQLEAMLNQTGGKS